MKSHALLYDMRDIFDSYFVQKQAPSLARMSELKELYNDGKSQTQQVLNRITGLSPDKDAWESCIFYSESKMLPGYMLLTRMGRDTISLRDIYNLDGAEKEDIFLLRRARAVRSIELENINCNKLYIMLPEPWMYHLCAEYIGEGCELI